MNEQTETFVIRGTVIRGKQLGRTLGFPTANIACDLALQEGMSGVYAGWTVTDGKLYPVVVNIGRHPTFPEGAASVEAYLIGFRGDLYAKELQIRVVEKLREEILFPDGQSLAAQLQRDVQEAIQIIQEE